MPPGLPGLPAAITSAALTGLLGRGTTGLGGAAGVVLGLLAGGVAGWIAATAPPTRDRESKLPRCRRTIAERSVRAGSRR